MSWSCRRCWREGRLTSARRLGVGEVQKAPVMSRSAWFCTVSKEFTFDLQVLSKINALYSRIGRIREQYSFRRVLRSEPHERPDTAFKIFRRRRQRSLISLTWGVKVSFRSKVKPRYLNERWIGIGCPLILSGEYGVTCTACAEKITEADFVGEIWRPQREHQAAIWYSPLWTMPFAMSVLGWVAHIAMSSA